jgi:pantoate--beta-alanine ligase
VAAVRGRVLEWHSAGQTVGLVPTMGALHEGHLSLVRRARDENDRVVVSVFVNPLQFGPGEDFETYPRRLEVDIAALAAERVDAAFLPSVTEMYPPGATTRVEVRGLDEVLEAMHRPGHFSGVATVVLKLFNAVRPDRAYFGQKDAQQAAIVGRLARDLDTGVEVRVCPTVREADGLALSSRNAYLSADERRAAIALSRALREANRAWLAGERDPARLSGAMRATLASEPLAAPDYAEVVDPQTFREPGPRSMLAVLAVRIGRTRLIDNHLLGQPL